MRGHNILLMCLHLRLRHPESGLSDRKWYRIRVVRQMVASSLPDRKQSTDSGYFLSRRPAIWLSGCTKLQIFFMTTVPPSSKIGNKTEKFIENRNLTALFVISFIVFVFFIINIYCIVLLVINILYNSDKWLVSALFQSILFRSFCTFHFSMLHFIKLYSFSKHFYDIQNYLKNTNFHETTI